MPLDLAPDSVVAGRFRLIEELGAGGMGVVWAAEHTVMRTKVALKFMHGPMSVDAEYRERFMREARAAAAVDHPSVVGVADVFELADGTPVMVMDLLEGESLREKLEREGRLSPHDTCNILLPVVSAVGTAHAIGVRHRDLKPDNIFLLAGAPAGGSVRVLDFGLAKLVGSDVEEGQLVSLTNTGMRLGTPSYMSPEQAMGEPDVDHRADVWAVGVILYECLAGIRPVEGADDGKIIRNLMEQAITPLEAVSPSTPSDLASLVGRMLSRNPADRPDGLVEVFATLSNHATVGAQEFGAPYSNPQDFDRTIVQAEPRSVNPVGDTQMSPIAGDEPRDTTRDHASPLAQSTPETVGQKRSMMLLLLGGGLAIGIAVTALPWALTSTRHSKSYHGPGSSTASAAAVLPPRADANAVPSPVPAALAPSASLSVDAAPPTLSTSAAPPQAPTVALPKAKPRSLHITKRKKPTSTPSKHVSPRGAEDDGFVEKPPF